MASARAQTTVAGDDEGFPTGLALDASGDLFVAEAGTSSVVEYAPDGSGGWSPTTIDSSGDLYQLRGVAVDSAGDIFVADTFADSVIEDTPNGAGGYTQHVLGLGSGLLPWGVATDAAGDLFVADTNHNRVIELPAVANTALPTITGTTAAGQVLTRSGGHWTSPDSLTYATQWELCNSSGNGCQNIAGATGATYTLTSADNGLRLTVAVTVTDQEGMSRRVTANPVGPVGS